MSSHPAHTQGAWVFILRKLWKAENGSELWFTHDELVVHIMIMDCVEEMLSQTGTWEAGVSRVQTFSPTDLMLNKPSPHC